MDDSQLTGSASSYARKYALNGLLCLDDVKDADGMNNQKNDNDGHKTNPLVDQAKINTIKKELERTGVKIQDVLATYRLKKIEEMNVLQFKDAMDKFLKYPTVLQPGTQIDTSIPESIDQELPFR